MNSVLITNSVKADIQTDTIKKAELVLKRLGLSREQAIALFFEQIALQQDLPFSFNKPNAETLQTFKDSEQGINLVECKDADDLFNQLGI
ncbi:MAG: type II toxin-antitoxin system RelB/DinJ family antitoxin [Methylococcales bacterium]|nr:type II toxin-antitoxin system RelB/DinJ family antitoxin [Methylococcales bacterium]MDP3840523.1 type II toxin-antitoxin system RelB/DinJ family antitoxin [Methylococcales bacterium]